MKPVLAFLILASCVGCAEMQSVVSVKEGPRAGIYFTSPAKEDRFLALDLLGLLVLEPDTSCAFSVKGNIPLSTDTSMPTFVTANHRAYFRIKQGSHGLLGDHQSALLEFSFIPEDGAEYTIGHIDAPNGFRMKYYKHQLDGKKVPFEVQGLDVCSGEKSEENGSLYRVPSR